MDRVGNSFTLAEAEVRNTQEFTLHVSQAETTNGNTSTFDASNNFEGLLVIDITAVTGTTPTANFYFETLDFLSGKYVAIPSAGTIAQQTGVNTLTVPVTNFGEKVRLRWVLGGTTPSFTFSAGFTAKS
ncbi:hypothetical protein O9H85_08170 [Paenibacillus filicis]|uniref:Uncharacterized protein n=1 Tax=Paenibacillus gyeongsangnamensis TaxID=3388067 RepID=A0ABT4Q6A4_9BACL|nr:hypothetical protein [Paenibacillus filicis]MCZ8512408.1 hypothetical protein [Paenibacillus filicis]